MCSLDGITEESLNDPKIKDCACMDDTKEQCADCGHGWQMHMHVRYEYIGEEEDVIDQSVQDMINQKMSSKAMLEAAIETLRSRIEEYENEQASMISIGAKFALFLKQNAIAIFNDDLEEYLNLVIREEEQKQQSGDNNENVLLGLREVKKNYQEQKKIFNFLDDQKSQPSAVQQMTPAEIDALIEQITALEINGQQLKGALDAI